jgi:hypothetical protein
MMSRVLLVPDAFAPRQWALSDLEKVLARAGFLVEQPLSDAPLTEALAAGLPLVKAAVLVLSSQYGAGESGSSIPQMAFPVLLNWVRQHEGARLFIWYPPQLGRDLPDEAQMRLIGEIRKSLDERMVFTNVSSPIEFVDDVRHALESRPEKHAEANPTEVFLMSNQLDEGEAAGVRELLEDIVPTVELIMDQESGLDYATVCLEQIRHSKLAVVYFKTSSDWALPFAQEIWKKLGGAGTPTPILLIGDTEPEENQQIRFRAPKVVSMIVDGILIPLEIKVQYDRAAAGLIS